jgi:uncharacterized protein (TIGR03435 family)
MTAAFISRLRQSALLFIPLFVGALTTTAQTAESARFDIVSIRPNTTGRSDSSTEDTSAGSIRAINITVEKLITVAYDVRDFQIEGGPEWIRSERFDIQAKLDEPSSIHPRDMSRAERRDHIEKHRQRLRNVLADRFSMRAQLETKDKPGYALMLAKGGHKLQPPSVDEHHSGTTSNSSPTRSSISGQGVRLDSLTELLSSSLGRAVVDETGISGLHDFKIEWTPDESATAVSGQESKGSVFTAIQEQLGLKLESKKVPTRMIVIEHIERPSEN